MAIHARISGREFHLHQTDRADAFGLETVVEIRVQRVHDLKTEGGII